MPEFLIKPLQVLVTVVIAGILIGLWHRSRRKMEARGWLPPTASLVAGSLANWLIIAGACVVIMESLGLPVRSVWAGILSVLVMVAIAFFASWSVLSNILSSLLLLTFSRLRVGDTVELRDSKRDEFGVSGRVIDINAFFVTLQELEETSPAGQQPAQVQIPNHLFFFRVMRRWPGEPLQPQPSSLAKITPTDKNATS